MADIIHIVTWALGTKMRINRAENPSGTATIQRKIVLALGDIKYSVTQERLTVFKSPEVWLRYAACLGIFIYSNDH